MKGITKEYQFFLFLFLSPLGMYISYGDFKANSLKFFLYAIKFFIDALLGLYFLKSGILVFLLFLFCWSMIIIIGSLNINILKPNFIWLNKELFNLDEIIPKKETLSVEYKGVNDIDFKRRNIRINSYQYKNKKVYLSVYDMDKKENRTFRKDRIR
ncbi:hypothetical protein [Cetobacterium sp.]|uniref:hypothetical protein n=1 Tax=Cetobacterium sp. TaxID=2071632 RepID=UPI003F30D04A